MMKDELIDLVVPLRFGTTELRSKIICLADSYACANTGTNFRQSIALSNWDNDAKP